MIRMNNPEAARAFLEAYWHADLPAALALCASGAVIVLARSLPLVTPAPVAEVLPMIFEMFIPGSKEGGSMSRSIECSATLMAFSSSTPRAVS